MGTAGAVKSRQMVTTITISIRLSPAALMHLTRVFECHLILSNDRRNPPAHLYTQSHYPDRKGIPAKLFDVNAAR